MSNLLCFKTHFLWFGKEKSDKKLPELILTIVLILLVLGSVLFGIGIVHFNNSTTPTPPLELTEDASFYILLSQSLVNILTTACTFASVMRRGFVKGIRNYPEVWVPTSLSTIVAIAAPIVYAGKEEAETNTQMNGMILSFSSSVCAIGAAIFSANLTYYHRDS